MGDSSRMTRLMKILYGIPTTAKTRLEKAVAAAVANAGSGGGGNAPLELTVTVSESGEKTVVTFDKTAAEVFAAVVAGKQCKATAVVTDGGYTITVTMVLPIEAFRFESGSVASYTFKCRCDQNSEDRLYYGTDFAADDTVVLTEV